MEEYEISINDFGCSDGDCYLKGIFRPQGQHTNGGCHCLRKLHPLEMIEIRKALLFRDNKIKEAEAENERLKKALKEAEDRIFEWNDLSDEG